MADLYTLKQWALQKKYESIEAELAIWQELARTPRLEKHFSQVQRVSAGLTGMIEVVRAEVQKLQNPPDPAYFFNQSRRAEFLILEIHRTWQFFRQKLAARLAEPFGEVLGALDEFVWLCYHPPVAIATRPRRNPVGPPFIEPAAVREPPLTYFNSEWSPAASARQESLPLEETGETGGATYAQSGKLDATRLVHRLIPVIGLPWFDQTFLPEALLLAHEAAHLLDFDLQLQSGLERNLSDPQTGLLPRRLDDFWRPWSAEVFADLYGTLCLGPAFAGALMILLAGPRPAVLDTPDPDNRYPPRHLRLLIVLEGLEYLGFGAEAIRLRERWSRLYGKARPDRPDSYEVTDYALAECAPEVPAVIRALLAGPFEALDGGSFESLKEIRWTPANQQEALKVKNSLLKPGEGLNSVNPRALLAGAQLAFEDQPAMLLNRGPGPQKTQADLIGKIVQSRAPGTRRGEADRSPAGAALSASRADRARAAGLELSQALLAGLDLPS